MLVVLLGAAATSAASAAGPSADEDTLAFIGLGGSIALADVPLVQRPLIRTRNVSRFAWSPGGDRIAFIGTGELQVIGATGSGLHRLGVKPLLGDFTWSPDGRRLAYTGARGPSIHIYAISAAGGRPIVLTRAVPAPVLPSWSRGGSIAFTSANTNFGRIFRVEGDGSRFRTLTRGIGDSFPTWSPDGRFIAFQRNECSGNHCGYSIYVMRADGSQQHRAARSPQYPGQISLSWSPDSTRIAFGRTRTGTDLRQEIVVVNRDGSDLRVLTKGLADATSPAWSPDGRRIAYGFNRNVYVMDANGAHKRLFVSLAGMPAWQPRR